ncbi:MAG: response regulator [Candidatus Omnitrophota bacterium]
MDKRRVLIIDDDKDVCDVIKDMLIRGGYDASTALDGKTGIVKAQEQQPNLILLDIMMPGMDGFEVLRSLKSSPNTSYIPIVIVSAKRDANSLFKARELRSSDYLMKPFASGELMKIVERCFSLFKPIKERMDPKASADIKDKLQDASTALDMLTQSKDVPKEFLDRAFKNLQEAIKMLKDT